MWLFIIDRYLVNQYIYWLYDYGGLSMKEYDVDFCLTTGGVIRVSADSKNEAVKLVKNMDNDVLKGYCDDDCYLEFSFVQEVKDK